MSMHNSPGFQFYHTNNGACPYRKEGIWENLSFTTEHLTHDVYEALLNQGFRRSGYAVYHPICEACQRCIPIRLNTKAFSYSNDQKRTLKKNRDLRTEHRGLEFTREGFQLYQKYQTQWHHAKEAPSEWEYRSFLLESPVLTEMIYYYLGKKLVGISWVDLLPHIISSVYFIFDPQYAQRRLGVFSLLYEINYGKQQGLPWLYLGYWVEDSSKMNYKSNYHPAQLLINKGWVPFEDYSKSV
ncbi:arginyltransferase [Deltaproteobacteria bacterium TL4]